MHSTDNHSRIDSSAPPTPKQPRLEEAPKGVSLGREVTVKDKIEATLFHLPEEIHAKIIRYLDFRGVTALTRVCKQLHKLVKNDKALERAWYRRLPSLNQYQLKTIVTTKDEQQLRDWLKPFADIGTIGSLIKQQKNVYFPVQLVFTNSKLMSQCEKFKLVEKTEITRTRPRSITTASFSTDGRHVVTAGYDKTVKITGQKPDGSWIETATVSHGGWVGSATFSVDSRKMVTGSDDRTAKICVQEDDGSWDVKATILHNHGVTSASFSADSCHVVTASLSNEVKIYSQETDGSWEAKYSINHNAPVSSVSFSADGRHLVILSEDNNATLYSQDDGSWKVNATIHHDDIIYYYTFSTNGRHLVTASADHRAIIYGLQDNGSWEEMTTIIHDYWVKSANFSADGRYVVTTSDSKAKIHGLQTAEWVLKDTIQHQEVVTSASFSADSRHLVTTSE
ncbi:F-box/WD repeat-containing protein, partial [Endozoicomonas sp. ONNA1]|uniref:F-box/WD repeat-containing protein n=1 Tax=Endozoicomonas sp. ONNA1 TaxID=2828740 RepID=UPI002148265E